MKVERIQGRMRVIERARNSANGVSQVLNWIEGAAEFLRELLGMPAIVSTVDDTGEDDSTGNGSGNGSNGS